MHEVSVGPVIGCAVHTYVHVSFNTHTSICIHTHTIRGVLQRTRPVARYMHICTYAM